MRIQFKHKMLFIGVWVSFLVSCSLKSNIDGQSGDILVKIPVQEKGEYRIDTVQLKSISSLSELSGNFAKFYFAPRLRNGEISGISPKTRFYKGKSGVFIPGDEISLTLASLYYNLQNLASLDLILGFNVNNGARKVAVNLQFKRKDNVDQNNSYYDGDLDAILFVPFREDSLPLTVNPGVLAHEHFHSLFHKLVFAPLVKSGHLSKGMRASAHDGETFRQGLNLSAPITENLFLLKAEQKDLFNYLFFKSLNEGIADFWGWIYSQDLNFLSKSLRFSGVESRSLGANQYESSEPLYNDRDFLNLWEQLKSLMESGETLRVQSILVNHAYIWGTRWARFLKNYTYLYMEENSVSLVKAQHEVAKLIVNSLMATRNKIQSKNIDIINPEDILAEMKLKNAKTSERECALFEEALGGNTLCGK